MQSTMDVGSSQNVEKEINIHQGTSQDGSGDIHPVWSDERRDPWDANVQRCDRHELNSDRQMKLDLYMFNGPVVNSIR